MKALKTTFIVVLVVAILTLWYMIGITIYFDNSHKLEAKEYEHCLITVPHQEFDCTKAEAKQMVKDLYNTPHFYAEKDLEYGVSGNCKPATRRIVIDKDLPLEHYVTAYAHELTHLKYLSADETFVTYKTFVTLYESDNEFLHYIGLKYAQEIVAGRYEGTVYDSGYYILEYLKGE